MGHQRRVRSRLPPPAESPQTIGSSAAERDLPSARDENRNRQSPLLAGRQSAPEVGILPSTGITRLHRYYDPARLPVRPAAQRPSAAFRRRTGSPTLPETPFQRAVLTTPADRAGASIDPLPARAAFPVSPAGRHPRLHFRGLLKVYTRYGPLNRSTAQGGLCREASAGPVAQEGRSPATRHIDSYLDGSFFHRCFAPSWRTEGVRGPFSKIGALVERTNGPSRTALARCGAGSCRYRLSADPGVRYRRRSPCRPRNPAIPGSRCRSPDDQRQRPPRRR